MDIKRAELFEKQAERILGYLKSPLRYDHDFLPRPFFIEFTGSPSSGKTTTIIELDKFLRRHNFRVLRPQEGAEVIRHIPRTTPLYNLRTGLYALNLLIDLSQSHNYDVVIFDRCIFDTFCWMFYWEGKNLLNKEEKAMIQSFFLSRFWSNMIDIAYIMVCDSKVAMERELRVALSQKMSETTNPKTIEKLVDRYSYAYKTLSNDHNQLQFIDTTHIGEQEMVEDIATTTLDIFEKEAEKNKNYKNQRTHI